MPERRKFLTIEDAIAEGLWPKNKPITTKKGIPELEELGYKLFYIGKNADLYFVPGIIPMVLVVRTDRVSVFDIPTNLEIKGKAEIQTKFINKGFDFAEKHGVKTARLPMIKDIPVEIAAKTVLMELCRPLEITTEQYGTTGVEFIKRSRFGGSLRNEYLDGKDSYNLNLPKGLALWDPFPDNEIIFTPTTKGEKDFPLDPKLIRDTFPDIMEKVDLLFSIHISYLEERGVMELDGKLEFFINSKGEAVLGDEAFTPESSRNMPLDLFLQGIYKSYDKQITRDFAIGSKWKDMYKFLVDNGYLKQGDKLPVFFPEILKKKVLDRYYELYEKVA